MSAKNRKRVNEPVEEIEEEQPVEDDPYAAPHHLLEYSADAPFDIETIIGQEANQRFGRQIMVLYYAATSGVFNEDWSNFWWNAMMNLLDGIQKTEAQIAELKELLYRKPAFDGDLVGMSPDDFLDMDEIKEFLGGE